jgi:hypothetical protein
MELLFEGNGIRITTAGLLSGKTSFAARIFASVEEPRRKRPGLAAWIGMILLVVVGLALLASPATIILGLAFVGLGGYAIYRLARARWVVKLGFVDGSSFEAEFPSEDQATDMYAAALSLLV